MNLEKIAQLAFYDELEKLAINGIGLKKIYTNVVKSKTQKMPLLRQAFNTILGSKRFLGYVRPKVNVNEILSSVIKENPKISHEDAKKYTTWGKKYVPKVLKVLDSFLGKPEQIYIRRGLDPVKESLVGMHEYSELTSKAKGPFFGGHKGPSVPAKDIRIASGMPNNRIAKKLIKKDKKALKALVGDRDVKYNRSVRKFLDDKWANMSDKDRSTFNKKYF